MDTEKYKGPGLVKLTCGRRVEISSWKVIACPQKENLRYGSHERDVRAIGKKL